jgi:Ca2+-transporting ATPase
MLQLGVIYLPVANDYLRTRPLSFSELLICVSGAFLVFAAVEIEKIIKRAS